MLTWWQLTLWYQFLKCRRNSIGTNVFRIAQPDLDLPSRYLSAKSSGLECERLTWLLCISFTVCVICLLSDQYLSGLRANRFQYSVETIPIEDVPRPAIVVGAGDTLNPFGFVEKHRDSVGLADFDVTGEFGMSLVRRNLPGLLWSHPQQHIKPSLSLQVDNTRGSQEILA